MSFILLPIALSLCWWWQFTNQNITFHPELHSSGLYNTQKIPYGAHGWKKMLLVANFLELFLQATDWLVYEINNMSNPHSRGNSAQQTNAVHAQATVLSSGMFPKQIYISIW